MDDRPDASDVDRLLASMFALIHQMKASALDICGRAPFPAEGDGLRRLSYAQYRVLMFVWRSGRISVGEVAHGIGVTMATASQVIDRLVDDGLLARGHNPDDRRQVLIRVTERSQRVAEAIAAERRAQVERALAQLSPADAAAAPRVLDALVAALAAPEGGGRAGVAGALDAAE